MITGVVIHLHNEQPILVDLEALPAGPDRSVRCSNVRGVDGKRPGFVHDRHGTFIIPMSMIRFIEAPLQAAAAPQPGVTELPAGTIASALVPIEDEPEEPETFDEEPDEDLLARIRSV